MKPNLRAAIPKLICPRQAQCKLCGGSILLDIKEKPGLSFHSFTLDMQNTAVSDSGLRDILFFTNVGAPSSLYVMLVSNNDVETNEGGTARLHKMNLIAYPGYPSCGPYLRRSPWEVDYRRQQMEMELLYRNKHFSHVS